MPTQHRAELLATTEPTTMTKKAAPKRKTVRDTFPYAQTRCATTSGTNIAICIPNSPEFWNQPGEPVTPQLEKPKPLPAHDRNPCWAIFRLTR